MSWRFRIAQPALVGLGVFALVGCEALVPGGGEEEQSGPDPDRSVSTDLPDEEVTVRLAFTDGPEMVEDLADAFEEEHPQVTIEPEHTEFSDYEANLKLMMTSDSPPDIAQYNVQVKDLVGTGHILDLDPYQEAYDWQETFPDNTLEQMTMEETGQMHGTGYLYGVPAGMSLTGIYYNAELAEEAGIEVPPADLDEFEEALEQASEAGHIPLHVGALDSAGIHLWTELLISMMSVDEYRDWVNGEPDTALTSDAAVEATDRMVEWAEQDYINDSANGLGQADSTAEFASGDSVFLINGNWATTQVEEELGEDGGFFPLPTEDGEQTPTAAGSSVAYNVSSETEHPDVAAAFLDFLGTPEAAEIVSAGGFEPPNADVAPQPSGVAGDVHDGYSEVVATDGLTPFPDSAAPAAYDEMVSGVQGLLSEDIEPAEYLEDVQDVRDDYQAE